ncbi:hypothetical protein CTRI78_v009359 [Colletotrichum trifolii]|uniref:Secreted protein n=1 Tax=Colletotrichum trifolii TaxID=5466 RepID=A0A4R8R140_COLTR|nr:hypothetical protein CTRI78_v009359 [Colletotrichum trifolii]
MKFIAPTLLALGFVASSNAAFCNAGWSLEAGASCPTGDDYKYVYCCQEPGSYSQTFPTPRTCVNPSKNSQPHLQSCLGSGFARCC